MAESNLPICFANSVLPWPGGPTNAITSGWELLMARWVSTVGNTISVAIVLPTIKYGIASKEEICKFLAACSFLGEPGLIVDALFNKYLCVNFTFGPNKACKCLMHHGVFRRISSPTPSSTTGVFMMSAYISGGISVGLQPKLRSVATTLKERGSSCSIIHAKSGTEFFATHVGSAPISIKIARARNRTFCRHNIVRNSHHSKNWFL